MTSFCGKWRKCGKVQRLRLDENARAGTGVYKRNGGDIIVINLGNYFKCFRVIGGKNMFIKKNVKRIVSLMLALAMSVGSIHCDTIVAKAENQFVNDVKEINTLDEEFQVSFKITHTWDHHYNADIVLMNMSVEKINNWEIEFTFDNKIQNIWDARVASEEDGCYVIHNADWNQDIDSGKSVSFGITVAYEDNISIPKDCFLTRECKEVEGDYRIEFKEYSRWDNYVNGQIIITNKGDRRIEDWSLLLDTNIKIQNIWNANIIEYLEGCESYDFENAGYNQNIEPGQSVEFGFIATYTDYVKFGNYTLFEMARVDYDIDDFEEGEDGDKVIYDADDFECYDDYLDYLVKEGYIDSADEQEEAVSEGVSFKSARVALSSKTYKSNNIPILSPSPEVAINFGKDDLAIQNFCITGDKMYVTQNVKGANKALITKLTDLGTGVEYVAGNDIKTYRGIKKGNMLKFGHGQTLEIFDDYFLTVGNSKNDFGRCICFMNKTKIDSLINNQGRISYSDWKEKPAESPFKRLTKLSFANKSGKSIGIIKRADAALSESGDMLAIWCRTNDGKVQLSIYDFKIIKELLINTKANGISFDGKYKSKLLSACKASCVVSIPGKKDSVLQPNSSFQGMDIRQVSDTKWQVYITSGNQYSKKKGKKNELQISRITMQKDDKSLNSSNVKRVRISPNQESNSGFWEIEGCHLQGSRLKFLITPSGKEADKQMQYLASVKNSLQN